MTTINAKKSKWAEEDEEEEPVVVKGKKGAKVAKIRVPLRVRERKNLPRFGDAKVGEENVTLLSKDFVSMEYPDNEETEDPAFAKTLASLKMKVQIREQNLYPSDDEKPSQSAEPEEKPKAGKYIPPGAQGGSSSMMDKDGTENTLRVSNLTKAVTEEDLRDLFERFGRIHRVSLPRVEDTRTGEKVPRGFAYIAFAQRGDAEAAMERLQGYGYDHLIIKIEWAKPNKDGGGGGGGGGRGMSSSHYSGYGKQLAQDTTEKAFFTSNR